MRFDATILYACQTSDIEQTFRYRRYDAGRQYTVPRRLFRPLFFLPLNFSLFLRVGLSVIVPLFHRGNPVMFLISRYARRHIIQ